MFEQFRGQSGKSVRLVSSRQWCTQDLAKGEGAQPGFWGLSPSRQQIFTVFTKANTHFSTHFSTGFGKGGGGATGILEVMPQPPTNFLRFSHKKTLILVHCFIEKGHAVNALTAVRT